MAFLTKERQAVARANQQFKGGPEQLKHSATISNPQAVAQAVRKGDMELAHAPWMLDCNRHVSDDYEALRPELYDRNNPADVKELRSRMVQAYTHPGSQAAIEYAAYKELEITADIRATPWSLAAFQTVNLADDELLYVSRPRSKNLQQFAVRSIGQDGGARQDMWRTAQSAQIIDNDMISTDRVSYPLWDLQQGDINQADQVKDQLNYNMDMKIDGIALANINAAQADSGLRSTFHIYPTIDVTNIPDTNYLDLSGTNPGVLTLDKIKTILLHIALFGAAGGADVPITIKNIFMCPQNLRDSWDFTSLVSGYSGGASQPDNVVPFSVREDIFKTGMMTSAWGYSWSWQPNAQLSPGQMYITTDQPLGWQITKSNRDRVLTWDEKTSADYALKNRGEQLMQKVSRFWFPDEWRYRIVIVQL